MPSLGQATDERVLAGVEAAALVSQGVRGEGFVLDVVGLPQLWKDAIGQVSFEAGDH